MRGIAALVRSSPAPHVQIDFDATRSERDFYGRLLADLRARLPRGTTLSITALASWCFGDRWLDRLPVDFAVPMLFRMGWDGDAIRRSLAEGSDFGSPSCRRGVGVSLDEPIPPLFAGRPVYVFSPQRWSPGRYQDALAVIAARVR